MFYDYTEAPRAVTGIQAVIERYVGKRPELIHIEAELEKLCKRIKDESFSVLKGNVKTKDIKMKEINDSAENEKIQKLFKKLFGLKDFELMWVKTSDPNAYTACKTMQILDKGYKVDKNTGVDVNGNLKIYVGVNTGMITLLNMTHKEILAIILHEVGHNFYQSAFQVINRVSPFNPISTLYGILMSDVIDTRPLVMKFIAFKEIIADFLGVNKIKTIIEEITVIRKVFSLRTLKTMIGLFTGVLTLKPGYLSNKLLSTNTYTGYAVEKHADSFAVDYGYGVDLASALNKMDQRVENVAFDTPIFNVMKDFENLLYDITFQTFSGYPTMHNRQVSVLKRLKKAQNDPDLPANLRKDLDHQIEEMEAYYENYMSISNNENKKRIFTWAYRKMLDTLFGGIIDMRELLHKMDGAYKEDWGDVKK